jgi:hypothetical protein
MGNEFCRSDYVPVMFVAKLAGGAAWTLALARLRKLDTQPR